MGCSIMALIFLTISNGIICTCFWNIPSFFRESEKCQSWMGPQKSLAKKIPSLCKAGSPRAGSTGCQVGFKYLQRMRLHNPSGQSVPVLCHPYSKEVPPHTQPEFPVIQFVPFASRCWTKLKRDWLHPLSTLSSDI